MTVVARKALQACMLAVSIDPDGLYTISCTSNPTVQNRWAGFGGERLMSAVNRSPERFVACRIDYQICLEYPPVCEDILVDRFDIQPGELGVEPFRQGIRLEAKDTIHP